MTPMIDFSAALLGIVAEFLNTEPIIYLFGMVIFCFVCKGIKVLMN